MSLEISFDLVVMRRNNRSDSYERIGSGSNSRGYVCRFWNLLMQSWHKSDHDQKQLCSCSGSDLEYSIIRHFNFLRHVENHRNSPIWIYMYVQCLHCETTIHTTRRYKEHWSIFGLHHISESAKYDSIESLVDLHCALHFRDRPNKWTGTPDGRRCSDLASDIVSIHLQYVLFVHEILSIDITMLVAQRILFSLR